MASYLHTVARKMMQKGDSKGGAEQHVFDGAAYTQTDPAWGSTEPGAESDIYRLSHCGV